MNPHLKYNGSTVEVHENGPLGVRIRYGVLYTANDKLNVKFEEKSHAHGIFTYHELTDIQVKLLNPNLDKRADYLLVFEVET